MELVRSSTLIEHVIKLGTFEGKQAYISMLCSRFSLQHPLRSDNIYSQGIEIFDLLLRQGNIREDDALYLAELLVSIYSHYAPLDQMIGTRTLSVLKRLFPIRNMEKVTISGGLEDYLDFNAQLLTNLYLCDSQEVFRERGRMYAVLSAISWKRHMQFTLFSDFDVEPVIEAIKKEMDLVDDKILKEEILLRLEENELRKSKVEESHKNYKLNQSTLSLGLPYFFEVVFAKMIGRICDLRERRQVEFAFLNLAVDYYIYQYTLVTEKTFPQQYYLKNQMQASE